MARIKISTIFFIIGILLISLVIYSSIIKPSYVSYLIACNPNLSEEKFPDSVILGQTTSFINESGELEIKVEVLDIGNIKEERKTLRHELVHVSQIKRGFPSLRCSNPVQKYIAEVEAYTLENLPDNIFYIFYDKLE